MSKEAIRELNVVLGAPNPCRDDPYDLLQELIRNTLLEETQPPVTIDLPATAVVTQYPVALTKDPSAKLIPVGGTTPFSYAVPTGARVTLAPQASGNVRVSVSLTDPDLLTNVRATLTTQLYSVSYVISLSGSSFANLLPAQGYGFAGIGSWSAYNTTDLAVYGDTLQGVLSYSDVADVSGVVTPLLILTASDASFTAAAIAAPPTYVASGTGTLNASDFGLTLLTKKKGRSVVKK